MERLELTGKDLIAVGFAASPAIATAITLAGAVYNASQKEEAIIQLQSILAQPQDYLKNETWSYLAEMLMPKVDDTDYLKEPQPYAVCGEQFIEEGARTQMNLAVRLPVVAGGALMPDAHQGYGLPIGGVLAAKNAVIPYGVGVDIGCRMCLSVYNLPADYYFEHQMQLKRDLIANTNFGAGGTFKGKDRWDHPVLQSDTFNMNGFLRNLKDKAASQIGTSGGGNHFVEWGIMEFKQDGALADIPAGQYLALLSHSGSRGMGGMIAGHYTKLAKSLSKLPKEAQILSYLDLNSEEGMEYWLAMNLAGDYASANHEIIHAKLTKALGAELLARVENHHNFAWKEELNGEEVIVHRKGATPAGEGVLGIIPGSMAAPGYLVRGKGNTASIQSAAHGAGRQMSRTKANATFTRQGLKEYLKEQDIMLIGGDTDEAPGAYKDIEQVMAAQTELVDVLGQFQPKMVRMADDGSRED